MALGSLARRPTVLIVLHQEHSTPGRIGLALKAMGVRLDIRRPSCGEPLPGDVLADHDGVVAFGGPMGANDTLDLGQARDRMARNPARREQTAVGPLLLARKCWPARSALGSSVTTTSAARDCRRLLPDRASTPSGDRLCSAQFPRTALPMALQDGFDLPEGTELLAVGGANFPNQAYRYGRHAVGLQFHPEVTYHMMCRWTHRGAERLDPARGAEPPRASRRLVPA